MRTEKTIRERLEQIESDIEEVEGSNVQSPMEAYAQALRFVLREREQDDPVPLGSRWRQAQSVTGQIVANTEIRSTGMFDEAALHAKSGTGTVRIGGDSKPGEYVLVRKEIEHGNDVAAEYESPVDIGLD